MKKVFALLAVLLVGLLLFSCESPINKPFEGETNSGDLTVNITESVSRTILPDQSMDPASYLVEGVGPENAVFSESITGGSLTVEHLAFGEWSVTVTAYNSDGTAIGAGSTTVTVQSNSTATANVTVTPYDGYGTLDLTLNWIDGQVDVPQVESILTPSVGGSRDLNFTIDGAQATFSASDVSTGYHTLTLKLLDNGYLNMGAVEVVRIVNEATSTGVFTFDRINQATGTLDVNITADMAEPLEVSISGAEDTKAENLSMTMTSAVANYAENVTYVWYVNGDTVETGSSFTMNNSWAQGFYRVDVTAYSADGSRAGSASNLVEVIGAEIIPVNSVTMNQDSAS